MKPIHEWLNRPWSNYQRGIITRNEISRQLIDEISFRGIDPAAALNGLPDECLTVFANFFDGFIPEDDLPLSYIGTKTMEQEREDEERYLSTARALVAFFSSKIE
jgi:hypothetical protein